VVNSYSLTSEVVFSTVLDATYIVVVEAWSSTTPSVAVATINASCADACPSGTVDCAGVCDGDAVLDACGICNGDGTSCPDNNLCVDAAALNCGDVISVDLQGASPSSWTGYTSTNGTSYTTLGASVFYSFTGNGGEATINTFGRDLIQDYSYMMFVKEHK
jgi:hypothetical protein